MKKKYVLLIAIFISFLTFVSCGTKAPKVIVEEFLPITDIDSPKTNSMTLLSDDTKFIYWKEGELLQFDVLSGTRAWKRFMSFAPGFLSLKTINDGDIQTINPAFLEDVRFSQNGKRAVATLKLGYSLNGSVAVVDIEKDEMIYSIPIERRPKGQNRKGGIGLKNAYYDAMLSDDGKYMVTHSVNYKNTRSIVILDIDKRELFTLENAYSFALVKDTVFFIGYNPEMLGISFYSIKLGEKKAEQIQEFDEKVNSVVSVSNRVFVFSENAIYTYEVGKDSKLREYYSLNDLRKEFKSFLIVKTYATKKGEDEFLFMVVKQNFEGLYAWKIYAKRI